MKAAQFTEYDGNPSLHINEIDKPAIGKGQVLVEVCAAGVNPFDVKVQTGSYKDFFQVPMPGTLGSDLAGTVVEIGEDASGFEVGQAVFGQAGGGSGKGSFAEFAPVKATQLAGKPENLDYVTAAAFPLVSVSAYQALVDHMDLQPGQKVLIHGAAGGIGSIAVQLAKHLGAYVAATAGPNDLDYVKNLGADVVVDYKNQDFADIVADYDAVFDTVGGATNTKSYGVLKQGGTLVSMVQPVDEATVKAKGITYVQQQSKPTPERLGKIKELIETGALKINIDKVFPLEQAADALDYLKNGHVRGKVVIQVKA
jgi:NADPH:quinone reductase-like Zn-dependent oxidoreductase